MSLSVHRVQNAVGFTIHSPTDKIIEINNVNIPVTYCIQWNLNKRVTDTRANRFIIFKVILDDKNCLKVYWATLILSYHMFPEREITPLKTKAM